MTGGPLGIWRVETLAQRRLSAGLPLTMTGPLWLRRRAPAAVRSSRPSVGELWPWQVKQYLVKIGRTSCS